MTATVSAQSSDSPSKVAVQAWLGGLESPNAELTRGLVIELTHRLQTSPRIIVREAAGGSSEDIDYVVRLTAATTGRPRLRWELQRRTDGATLASDTKEVGSDQLAWQPGQIAAQVLRRLTLPLSSRDTLGAAADPAAYVEFLQILGQADETFEGRIAALEKLLPRLGDYAPAIAALGSDYVDRAGIVKSPAPLYERAAAALERALELEPTYPPARAKLASLYAKVGRSERAVELLRDGLTRHPNYAPYHETLGYVLRYAGLMQESIDSYTEGQKLDASIDNLVSTQDQITKSYIYLGDYDRALESHRRMRSFLDGAKRTPDEKQWFYEGVIHLYRADSMAAVNAFRAGERRLPNSIWTAFGRGYAAMAQQDSGRVATVLDELEGQDIVDGERHYRLVHFAVYAGRPERALHHLQVAVDGGFFNAPYIATDPWLASLRTLPQFAHILSAARTRHDAVRRSLAADTGKPPAGAP
jgi:tetratricopeptide (TPR) repeat protein